MVNGTEEEERAYLEHVLERLELSIQRTNDALRNYSAELQQNKEYIYEHQSGMDEADMVAAGQSINRMAFTGESAVTRQKKLVRLIDAPYFGRIDFFSNGGTSPVYIGIGTFSDPISGTNLVYDWRAPISSMFYDFELGPASYVTPSGKIAGSIEVKRQYRITKGRMEFMIENAVNIHDDILQQELSRSSDDRMKNIVATIQRDQNAVIRNESAPVMIIQGVAGSGKTSIALHRIAFLLYRFRDSIAAKNILIISPNRVFADYISNVLPELGEEHIPETVMEDLAEDLFEGKYSFQTFFQQVSLLLERDDQAFIERIRFKSSFEFLSKLNQHLIHVENRYFEAVDLNIAGNVIPADHVYQRFRAYHHIPLLNRFPEVVKDVLQYLRNLLQRKLTGHEKSQVWQSIPKMFRFTSAMELYRDFFSWVGRPELLIKSETLEYSDVFPLILYMIRLEGVPPMYGDVKHLLVDEMQDYTPVQYAVLSRLFRCNKTILGDVNQTVNSYSASSAEVIERVFPQAETVKLFRSYRSTWEITKFTQRISSNPNLIAMERHGTEPETKGFPNNATEIEGIREILDRFKLSDHTSIGIICKTLPQAEMIFTELRSTGPSLLTAENRSFKKGIIITTVHLAKGLEFDEVIVPFASARNYATHLDKGLLYIACTRAMHLLTLTWSGERTGFIGS